MNKRVLLVKTPSVIYEDQRLPKLEDHKSKSFENILNDTSYQKKNSYKDFEVLKQKLFGIEKRTSQYNRTKLSLLNGKLFNFRNSKIIIRDKRDREEFSSEKINDMLSREKYYKDLDKVAYNVSRLKTNLQQHKAKRFFLQPINKTPESRIKNYNDDSSTKLHLYKRKNH